MSEADINKWGRELIKDINAAFVQCQTRQMIFNEFLCEKLSDEDQSLLVGKLIAHDNQTQEDRDAIKKAEMEKDLKRLFELREVKK
jgi:hypothetical protein